MDGIVCTLYISKSYRNFAVYIYRTNGARKKLSIYILHRYPTVYLPELSSKLKTVWARTMRTCGMESTIPHTVL